jgi:hypothetical protein
MELDSIIEHEKFRTYCNTFVHRYNGYTVMRDGEWSTRDKILSDIPIAAHIAGQYQVGCRGGHFANSAVLDFDDVQLDTIYRVRENIGLDESTSLLCTSASDNSYHLYFRPCYSGEQVTVPWLHDLLKSSCIHEGKRIELYPDRTHALRLPFGPMQRIVSPDGQPLEHDFSEKMYWFEKLDHFDLNELQFTEQLGASWSVVSSKGIAAEGAALLETGLIDTNTRNDSQWKVLYLFWRQNVPRDVAVERTWGWICAKHNDLSTTMRIAPGRAYTDICDQADYIWDNYDRISIPGAINSNLDGYLTLDDIKDIIRFTNGNIPHMKFLSKLVSYRNARQDREYLSVHSSILKGLSSSYLKYLDHFQSEGILSRKSQYSESRFAKSISLNWPIRDERNAICIDGRNVDLMEAITEIWSEDIHDLIKSLPISRQRRWSLIRMFTAA